MESKKANLIIDIAKNIVEQYRDQLEKSIEQHKLELDPSKEEDKYTYENTVERAERCLEKVNNILNNFEKSIFDGVITDNKTTEAYYDKDGRHMRELKYYDNTLTKEEKENIEAINGAQRLMKELSIPEYTMYPVTFHAIQMFTDKNHVFRNNEYVLDTELLKLLYPKFKADGKYKTGNLEINNLLSVAIDSKTLIANDSKPITYYQGNSFVIDTNPIVNIVNNYVKNHINENYAESIEGKNKNSILSEQNSFLDDTFDTISRISGGSGSNDSIYEDSPYYYEYLRKLDKNFKGVHYKYFEAPRVGKIKNELSMNEKIEKVKKLLQTLEELSVQEQKLTTDLNLISEQKQSIIGEVNGFKL